MTPELKEARKLLAELSGYLRAMSEYASPDWVERKLLQRSEDIDAFLSGERAEAALLAAREKLFLKDFLKGVRP
jgi:hypothetical protein